MANFMNEEDLAYLWSKIKSLVAEGSTKVTRKTYEEWYEIGDTYIPSDGEFIIYTTRLNKQGLAVLQNSLKIGDGHTPISLLEFINAERVNHTLKIGNISYDGSSDVSVPIYDGTYK